MGELLRRGFDDPEGGRVKRIGDLASPPVGIFFVFRANPTSGNENAYAILNFARNEAAASVLRFST
jgi:hypothetical protein